MRTSSSLDSYCDNNKSEKFNAKAKTKFSFQFNFLFFFIKFCKCKQGKQCTA